MTGLGGHGTKLSDAGVPDAGGSDAGVLANQVDGVLFDVDDTLVDTRGAFTVAWEAAVGQFLPHLGADDVPAVVRTWRADAGGYYAAYTAGRMPYAEQRVRRVNALHAEHGGPELDEDAFASWNEVFESAFQGAWTAFEDALAAIASVRRAGIAVGVVTNARSDYQRLKLERAGIEVPEVLVGMDAFGVGKPDPRVFLEGAALLGTAPGRTVYVGDELHVDALGALTAGLRGVWLDRPGTRGRDIPEGEIEAAVARGAVRVESLGELADALVVALPAGPGASSAPPRAWLDLPPALG
ncbi:MAG: HAD family hydrolase [Actinomycetota bacterium]|nr:HAD family hydrolase [Actinomycetota bacterium]